MVATMDTTGIPHDLCSVTLILEALPAEDRQRAHDRIHRAHLSGLDGAVQASVREALRATRGAEAADRWARAGAPARFTNRDIFLAAKRHGADRELIDQGFIVPDDTLATVEARTARLADLWAELKDLATDLATSGVHGAKTKVAAALEMSVDTVDRRFTGRD
jgi:hypothetical protein